MIKRTLTLLALASAATCLTASTADAAGPTAAKKPERTTRFIIANTTRSTLGLTSLSRSDNHDSWRETPGDIASGVTGDYTEMGFGATTSVGATIAYQVRGTDYSLKISGDNPWLGVNHVNCQIELNGSVVSDAPYRCDASQTDSGDYNDANFLVAVTPNATDRAEAAAAGKTERTARFVIANSTHSDLGLTSLSRLHKGGSWRTTPGDVASGSTGDYTETTFGATNDVGARMTYQILGTLYSVTVWGDNPWWGANDESCEVDFDGAVATNAPYQCQFSESRGDYNDANFIFAVTPV